MADSILVQVFVSAERKPMGGLQTSFLIRCCLVGMFVVLGRGWAIAAPANDLCSGAEVIPGSGPFPFYSSVIADVSGATTVGDPPAPSCTVGVSRSVWYKFTPATSGLYTLSVSGDTGTTVPDTVMALYSSPAGCAGPFTQVGCNDDSGGLRSAISTNLIGATAYFIVVWVSTNSAPLTNGHGAVQLKLSHPLVPTNDVCSGAEIIPGNGPFPYLTSVSDETLATTTGDPPAPLCQASFSRSLWYKFTPAATTTYTLSTCSDTATTVFDTLVAIYISAGGCGGPFTAVACNDNSCSFRAAITTMLNAGVTYYVVVWESGTSAYTPGETSVQLRISGIFAPVVLTTPATSISSTGAVLNATVNPSGAATTAWFDWGTTTNYSSSIATQVLGSGTFNIAINAQLTGLTNLTYFFRVRATNVIGASAGTNLSFGWVATRPLINQPAIPSNGTLAFQFSGVARQKYLILSSTNLANWLLLGTGIDNGNGTFNFVDPNTASFPRRFYRVLAP